MYHVVSNLSYAGDEGGIMCHLSRSEENRKSTRCIFNTCAGAAFDATCSGRSGLSKAPNEEDQEAGLEVAKKMAHAIIRGRNGRRYEVDFKDSPIRVEVHASEETIEIFVEADFETHPEERRRFAIINIPRHLFSEATRVSTSAERRILHRALCAAFLS